MIVTKLWNAVSGYHYPKSNIGGEVCGVDQASGTVDGVR